MSDAGRDPARPLDGFRVEIVERLRVCRSEIAQAIYMRIQEAVPDSIGGQDPTYQAGILAAVTAVIDYCLDAIEHGPGWSGPVPSEALAQARRAACTGVSVGTVVRRYVAGHGELGEFVMKEAQRCGLSNNGAALYDIRRMQEALLEHITATVEHEYNQECARASCSPGQRRAKIVQRLLSGESVDPADMAELDYEVHNSWHVGLIATGAGAEEFIRGLKTGHTRNLLAVSLDGNVSAWLAAQTTPTVADIDRLLTNGDVGLSLAVGEPGRGIDGWRLTHAQAQDALRIALRRSERFARYEDDALLTAAVPNDTLVRSLTQKYLIPLSSQRDGGATLRHTLRVYIDLECNATSAAEVLKVGRRAVKSRVCTAERLIGCALHRRYLAELDVALRLEDLDRDSATDDSVARHGEG